MLVSELVAKLLQLDQSKPILIDISPPAKPPSSPFIDMTQIADHGPYYVII
jgi:hypothetical protein